MPTRRSFLQSCAVVAATPLVASAIEPIARNGAPKIKFSLAAYSYRDLLKSGELTISDFIADCAKMQLDGTELTSYYFPDPLTEAYLRQLKSECFRAGLTISGTAVGNDFGHPEGAERDKQIAAVCRWVDYAEILGAPVIRIFAGHKHKGTTDAEAHRLMVDGMQECCDYAGQHGIFLALENHGGPTSTADSLLKLVHDVHSPWFGVNLDTGNFHSDSIYEDLARVAPYAVNVQVKVVIKPATGKKQPADFKRLAKSLSGAGYRGFVVLEYEEAGDPRIECPKFLDQLRAAFA
jgi:sugar phosphate isomerase/epimerase